MPSILLLVLLLLTASAASQASPLFEGDTVLEVELSGPIAALTEDTEERNRHRMSLRVGDLELDVQARVRGKSRARVCRFPPIRLYFDDAQGSVFEGQHKLKLVTHCRDTDAGEANVLDELAAYRVFAAISEAGYRTRLLKIRYRDTDPAAKPRMRERYGFLIESEHELAARLGGEPLEVPGVTRSEIDERQAALVYVFEYMIGNTDWSLVRNDDDDKCCHNIDLIRVQGSTFPVPYDFDLSGLVDAPYAEPDPSLRIRSVRQRRYRGYCLPTPALGRAIAHINERRGAIMAAAAAPPASEPSISDIVAYLDDFFGRAEDADRLVKRFERRCL